MKCLGAIVVLICALATHVEAAEIKVISTGGARAVMTSVVPEFERKTGHKVSIDFGTPGNMRDRLLQGETADVAIAIAATLPDLEKAGKIASGTRMEFAASYVGVVVRAGAPKLDVSTPASLKRAVLNAKTVALSDPKAGTQLGATFIEVADRLGFGSELRSRTKMILGPGSDVAAAVARREADLGFTLISEILPVTGVTLGGELPSSIMEPTVMHAFLVPGAKNAEAAKGFLDFLRSPETTKIIEAKGMKPGPRALAGAATAADLVILTNQGATPGVKELAAAFSRGSGHKVTVIQADDAVMQQKINDGTADLITGNPGTFDELVKNGKVVGNTVTPFVRAGLGLSVRAGARKPDISTVEAYKAALLAAKSIGYSRGCSGTNIGEGIEQLGLTAQLKGKTIFTTGGPVTDYLARGDFEIGIQQTNIMVGVPGTDFVGPLPGFLNKPCQSNVALLTNSKQPEAARALIRFMISPEAAPLLRKTYVEPFHP